MNILFVCTGNIFRSMSAEYLTREYLNKAQIHGINVSSAGTIANIEEPFLETVQRLNHYNCDPTPHHQTKITKEILADKDIIICMSEHHRTFVRALGYDAVLFNEIAYDKTEDLMDDTEYQEKYGIQSDLGPYIIKIVDYIYKGIPLIIKYIKKNITP